MESGGAATLRSGGEVRCVALAGGGGALAAGAGAALRLWRPTTPSVWRAVAVKPGAHRYGVTALAWGAALLASGGVDGAVRLWGGELRGVALLGAPGAVAVRALCWAGARLAVGHDDGALRVWDARGVLLASLRAHDDALTALAAPAAALLVTAAADGVLKVYDFNEVCNGSECSPLEWRDGAHDLGALCAAASPHQPVAATAGHDGKICVWRMQRSDGSWQVTSGGVLLGHSGAVSALSWTGDILASSSHDRTARLWRLNDAADDEPAGICVLVLHAHTRYLTTVAIDYRQRILVTGSSDKTVRVWTLGDTTVNDELQPTCEPSSHFGLGDLEGIEPMADDELVELDSIASSDSGHEEEDDEWCGGMCARRVYSQVGRGASVNCLCASGNTLASATSDGSVYVWTWHRQRLRLRHKIAAHEYPALSVALPTPALLSAGLDGVLKIWDLETSCLLRTVCVGGSERVGEEAGVGVRGAAVTQRGGGGGGGWRVALATDAGTVQLWRLADDATQPDAIYAGFSAACACAAWAACGRAVAGGGAGGELRVWAPHRRPPELAGHTDAHDLGVQAVGWSSALSTGSSRVLASVGADSYLKLWIVEGDEDSSGGSIQLATSVEAHGGAAAALCWQPDVASVDLDDVAIGEEETFQGSALVATGGEDRWARVWAARRRGGAIELRAAHAMHLRAPVLALALLPARDPRDHPADSSWCLAAGTLAGAVSVWALQAGAAGGGADLPRHWPPAAVLTWLQDYLTAVPGSPVSIEEECQLLERVREKQLTGAFLLDTPIAEVLEALGYGWDPEAASDVAATRRWLLDELHWLRRPPHPHTLEALAPHHLLCPLTHTLFREPVRAADGFTYERATLTEHFLIEGGAVSGVTGRRLASARVQPNRGVRHLLRAFLLHHRPLLYADLQDHAALDHAALS